MGTNEQIIHMDRSWIFSILKTGELKSNEITNSVKSYNNK